MKECPVCRGYAASLGSLGKLTHYRCQDCGIDFNVQKRGKNKTQLKQQTKAIRQARKFKQQRQEGE